MKPLIHAKISVKRHGGHVDDYLEVHNFLDSSKSTMGDVRHRALLHNTFGCFLCERIFGTYLTNSDGKMISVRDLAEEHIIEDLGFLPTPEHWLKAMPIEGWMGGMVKKKRKEINLAD